jgi:hypothetical protein
MQKLTVHTLTDFTRYIEETYLTNDTVMFRGQADGGPTRKLLPSIARMELKGTIMDMEQEMLSEFQRNSVPHLQFTPATTWDWLALAQHHGLPTRMLDWTLNPFTALWFVINEPPKTETNGVVWILQAEEKDFARPKEMNTLACKRHMIFRPKHITERITAQLAYLTVHKGWSEEPDFEPLEESAQFKSRLTRVEIPRERFAHFRFHLNRFGINYSSVYPGLDGLSNHIRWQVTKYNDEGWIN